MPLRHSPVLTPRLLAACRANARRGGPRTARGKARSCLNSLRHGRYVVHLRAKLQGVGDTDALHLLDWITLHLYIRSPVRSPRHRQQSQRLAARFWCAFTGRNLQMTPDAKAVPGEALEYGPGSCNGFTLRRTPFYLRMASETGGGIVFWSRGWTPRSRGPQDGVPEVRYLWGSGGQRRARKPVLGHPEPPRADSEAAHAAAGHGEKGERSAGANRECSLKSIRQWAQNILRRSSGDNSVSPEVSEQLVQWLRSILNAPDFWNDFDVTFDDPEEYVLEKLMEAEAMETRMAKPGHLAESAGLDLTNPGGHTGRLEDQPQASPNPRCASGPGPIPSGSEAIFPMRAHEPDGSGQNRESDHRIEPVEVIAENGPPG